MNEYIVSIGRKKKTVQLPGHSEIFYDGKIINYELTMIASHIFTLKLNKKIYEIIFDKTDNEKLNLLVDGHPFETVTRTALQEKAFRLLEESKTNFQHHHEVKAPMPGIILKIKKNSGEQVQTGDSVIILEAMKMENEIKAPSAGIITDLKISEGQSVEKNSLLFSIKQN